MSTDNVVPDRYDRYLNDTAHDLQTGTWTSNPYSRRNMMNAGGKPSLTPSLSPTRVSPHKSSSSTSPYHNQSSPSGSRGVLVFPQTTIKSITQGESGDTSAPSISSPPPSYVTKQPKLCFSRFLPHDINDVNYLIEKSATPHFMRTCSARIRGQSSSPPSDSIHVTVSRQVLTDKEELQLELPSIVSSSPKKSRGGAVPTALFTSKLDRFNSQVYTGGLKCRHPYLDDDTIVPAEHVCERTM